MTSEEPDTNSTPDLFGEGPGNSARHDVPKEGPGNQSVGILGSSVKCGTAVKRKFSNYTIDTKYLFYLILYLICQMKTNQMMPLFTYGISPPI